MKLLCFASLTFVLTFVPRQLPSTSLGWFRAGVGFFNKKQYEHAIECLERAVALDPKNFNAFQIMARACIAVNRRTAAIEALKQSVKLDNPSDWQLLVELTGTTKPGEEGAENALEWDASTNDWKPPN